MIDVKKVAEQIELLLRKHSIKLGESSDLLRMLVLAKQVQRKYIGCSFTMLEWFRLLQFRRISSAVILLESDRNPSRYLRAITRGSLNLFSKQRSLAKDTLWELELWAMLKRKLASTYLLDPPDVMIEYADARLGVSCKKIYSEAHVQNIMSEAVGQIKSSCEVGVVALNLDSLIPEDTVLKAPTFESAREILNEAMGKFLEKHERHIKKYFVRENLLAILVTMSPVADITNSRGRFNVVTQSRIWTMPQCKARHELHYRRFRDHIETVGSA